MASIGQPKDEKPSEEESNSKILCLAKEMLPCKLMFFVMDAAFATAFSFLSLFYIANGLHVDKIGLSSCIGSVFSMIATPLWGGFIDSMIKGRVLFFTIMILAVAIIELGKPWLVLFVADTDWVPCGKNTTIVGNSTSKPCVPHKHLNNPNQLFYAVTLIGVFSSVLFSGMMCYVETAILKTIYTREKAYDYGEQKVFGPIGSAVGSLMAGVAVDHYRPKSKYLSPYLAAFYIFVPCILLMWPLLYILTKQAKWDYGKEKKTEGKKKVSMLKHLKEVCKNPDNVVFLIAVLMSGLSLDLYSSYLFIYLDHMFKPSKTLLSVSRVVSTLSELAIYPFSSKIINFFGGQIRCIIIAIFSTVIRLAVVSISTQYWQVLVVQCFNGLGFSLGWTAMIEHTWTIFPKDITTTALGILVSLHWIAPGILSSLAGGFLYRIIGGPNLFRGMAILAGSWCLFMFTYFEIKRQRKEPEKIDLSEDNEKCFSTNDDHPGSKDNKCMDEGVDENYIRYDADMQVYPPIVEVGTRTGSFHTGELRGRTNSTVNHV